MRKIKLMKNPQIKEFFKKETYKISTLIIFI